MLRPVVIRHYLAVMASKGFSTELVLAGSGVDQNKLDDPSFLIDTLQCHVVINNMVHLSGDQGIGLDVGMQADLTALGIVGQASMTAKTMRDTYSLWRQYGDTLVGALGKFDITDERHDVLTLSVMDQDGNSPAHRFIVEELLTMTKLNMLRMAGIKKHDDTPVFTKVALAYAPPSYAHRYREFLNCPVMFGQRRSSVTIDKSWLEKQVLTCDAEFNKICLRHCEEVLYRIAHNQPVSAQLRNLFLACRGPLPRLEQAAATLNLSARTMRRRLQDEGTSYRNVVERFRADKAREYLRYGAMSPKEAAFRLGFNEPGSFRRAFKVWTGQTIGEYCDCQATTDDVPSAIAGYGKPARSPASDSSPGRQ